MADKNLKVEIMQEAPNDYPAVYDLNTAAFGRNHEAHLVDRLRGSDAFIPPLSLVAKIENKVVGHILFTRIDIVNDNDRFESLALAPMAVSPHWQRCGIGAQLIRYGFQEAASLGYKSVIVLGHEHFYPQFGFSPTKKWGIRAPFDVPDHIFMGIELVKEAFKDVSGVVKYADEFDKL